MRSVFRAQYRAHLAEFRSGYEAVGMVIGS